jgi:hypothetical protein
MKKLVTAAIGIGLAAGLVGCSESAPEPVRPNGTYEQVKQNLGGDDLGKLAVGQTLSLDAHGEPVKLYNLTKQPVDEEAFKRTVVYFASLGTKANTYAFNIYPNGADQPVSMNPSLVERSAVEHDFVLIPEGTPMPPAIDSGNRAVTRHMAEQLQEISVVPQEGGKKFEATNGLAVEACQSLVQVLVPAENISATDALANSVNARLAQETFCNATGKAATVAASGATYAEYNKADTSGIGTSLSFGSDTYNVDYPPLTATQYADMQQILTDGPSS